MTERPTSSPPQGNIKQALLEAREEAILSSRAERPHQEKRKSKLLRVLLVASIALGLYALTEPAWLITPPPEPEPVALTEASLRVALWQQSLYVERYIDDTGTAPGSLEEAGAPFIEGIAYQRRGETDYLLQGEAPGVGLILLGPEDSIDVFLGQSLQTITSRGRQ